MRALRLICDAGGTNIRVALSQGPGHIGELHVVPTLECSNLAAVLVDYVSQVGVRDRLASLAVAVAGPVDDGEARLTNAQLTINEAQLRASLNVAQVRLINDLEATAHALTLLQHGDFSPLSLPVRPFTGPKIVINVGTGFGAALLVPCRDGWQSVACEPGHMTLATLMTNDEAQAPAWRTIEDIVSGRALATTRDVPRDAPTPIVFSRRLGLICGDLVLACGAWGGAYLCGSVALAWARMAGEEQRTAFMTAFVQKGPMTQRMHRVPIATIAKAQPVLVGLSALVVR